MTTYLNGDGELVGVRVVVPGRPVPKSRPRFTRGGGGGVYSDPRQVAQEEAIAWALRSEMGHQRFSGPVEVNTFFFYPNRRHADGDNLLKLVMDAANHVAWGDDRQAMSGSFEIDIDPQTPRTVVFIKRKDWDGT